jgi:Putative transposase
MDTPLEIAPYPARSATTSYLTFAHVRIGIIAVLHTWGSALTHHPHVHMIVPGGGLSEDGSRWVASRPGFLVHVNVLSRLFRGRFLTMLIKAHALGRLSFFTDHAALTNRRRSTSRDFVPWRFSDASRQRASMA